ncbi:MAG: tetratricopeptide repeat protein [Bacteroidota bacterium]
MSKQTKTYKQPETKRKTNARNNASAGNAWIKYVLVAVIVIVTYVSFAPALKNNFTNWDDDRYILDNTRLQKTYDECAKFYFSNFFFSNYHPLTMMLYTYEFHNATPIKGIFTNPDIFHKTNVMLHLLNVLLVFWFIFLLSGRRLEVAAIVSLFFGIHPMHVESVAWIAELKDVLYTGFFIAGLIAYHQYISGKEKKNLLLYILTIVFFIISGLSKPAAVTFSLMLPLMDFYMKRKFDKFVWLEKIPFLAISLIFGYLTIKVQQTTSIAKFETFTILQRLDFASYSMCVYLYKLFLPINLSALYPYPHLEGTDLHLPYYFYFMPVIALAIFFLVYRSLKYTRLIAFGFLFFFLNIVLVLQFMSVGIALVAERYSYVPYIGLLFALAMGFSWVYRNNKYANYKSLLIVAVVALGITASYLTNARCKVWFSADTMWTDVIQQFPYDAEAYKNRGGYLVEKNKFDVNPGQNDFDRAFIDFNNAINIKPNDSKIYSNRGNIYAIRGKYDLSLQDYSMSIKLDSSDFNVYLNRGITYSVMEKYDSAFADWDKVMKIHGPEVKLYQNRAYAYLRANKFKECIDDFNKLAEMGISLQPNMYFFKAFANFKIGDLEQSVADNSKAIQMDPNYKEAYYNRSQTYFNLKKYKESLDDLMAAQRLGYKVDQSFIDQVKQKLSGK